MQSRLRLLTGLLTDAPAMQPALAAAPAAHVVVRALNPLRRNADRGTDAVPAATPLPS